MISRLLFVGTIGELKNLTLCIR